MAANPARGGANNPAGGGGGNNNNNANNGGGGGGGLISNAEHVEFSVKAEEDLYLTGTETTIRRVTAETNYSCLMLKTQRFSSLFRHYAKYHGLRKDDLEYYFVNCLENEDTPESVQLQRGDTIMVRKRRKPEPPEVAADDDNFVLDMKELLHDEEHMDALFIIQPPSSSSSSSSSSSNVMKVDTTTDSATIPIANSSSSAMIIDDPTSSSIHASGAATSTSSANTGAIHIRAHKAVLTARAEYFKALFRTNAAAAASKSSSAMEKSNPDGTTVTLSSSTTNTIPTASSSRIHFKESVEAVVNVESFFREIHIRAVLEFIYTNRITNLRKLSTDDLLSILHLSDKWLLRDMKRICEHEIIRSHLSVATVARLYGATEAFNAKRLSRACIEFIMSNLRQVMAHAGFLEEMNHFPHLLLPVLKAAADMIPEGPMHKKQRTTTSGGGSGSNSSAAIVAAAAAAASTPSSHSNSSNNNLNLPGVASGSGDPNMMLDPNVPESFMASLQHGGGQVAAAASAAIAQRLQQQQQQQHPPIPPLHAAAIGNVAFRSSPVPDSDP